MSKSSQQQMKGKEKWYVQVYDENGLACKLPRVFYGNKAKVEDYIDRRFGLADVLNMRTTIAYSEKDGYNEDNIPERINEWTNKK